MQYQPPYRSRQPMPMTRNFSHLRPGNLYSSSTHSPSSTHLDRMDPMFNQDDSSQGATTGMEYRGAPSTTRFARPRQMHQPYPSTYGMTQRPLSNNWQAQNFQGMSLNMENSFAMQPQPTPMVNPMPSAYTTQSQSQSQSQSRFAPATMYSQNNQFVGHASSTQSMAYGQQASFVNYGNPRAAPARREGPYTPYDPEYSYQQMYGQQDVIGSQWIGSPLQYAGHNNTQDQNHGQWFGAQQTSPQTSIIYNQPAPVDFIGQVQIPLHDFEVVPALFDDTFADDGVQTLFEDESQAPVDLVSSIDPRHVDTMSTVAEQVDQPSQSNIDVEAAVLNQIGNHTSASPPTQVPAPTSQQSHKRKHSAESTSSSSSKKSRIEKAADKAAEKERLAAERKAAEPPITAEQSERDRQLREITAKIQKYKRGTPEELRIYLPDDEVKSLREQFSELTDIDQWSDDDFRRKYVEQPGLFQGKVGAWKENSDREKIAQRKSNRQQRRMAQ